MLNITKVQYKKNESRVSTLELYLHYTTDYSNTVHIYRTLDGFGWYIQAKYRLYLTLTCCCLQLVLLLQLTSIASRDWKIGFYLLIVS